MKRIISEWLLIGCGLFLPLPLKASPFVPAGQTSVRIDYAVDVDSGERDPIQSIGDGKRLILFGEEPATYRFVGRIGGRLSSSVGYYWTFKGGTPERVPARGISEKPDSGAIKFSAAGAAQLHLVDREHPEVDLAQDTVWMCYGDLKEFGKDCVSYVPEGATIDRDGKLEIRTDWTWHTSPPLKGVYLGRIVSSKPGSEIVIPPYAVTDQEGCVHFTVSGNDSETEFGELSLKETPSKQDPKQIRRLARKNLAIIKADQPEALDIAVTVDPVTFYKTGVDDRPRPNAIEAIPAFRIHFPAGQRDRLLDIRDPENGTMEGWLHEPKIKYEKRKVLYHLPAPVLAALASLPAEGVGSLGCHMWYHERDHWRIEDGNYYIQIPKVQRVVYPLENGGPDIEAVTVLPRKGLLAAIAGKRLLVINADSGQLVSDSPFAGAFLCNRLTWINDDLILGTKYARRSSSYWIISVSQHKVIKGGESREAAEFHLSHGALVTPDLKNHGVRKLFSVPKRH